METVGLLALKLDGWFTLRTTTDPEDLGLARTPSHEHAYPTIEALCAFIESREVLDLDTIARLKQELQNSGKAYAVITKDQAKSLGFKFRSSGVQSGSLLPGSNLD